MSSEDASPEDASLDALRALCPPPAPESLPVPASVPGLPPLPADFARLTAVYGAGEFDEFLVLYAPGRPNPHLDLARRAEQFPAGLATLAVPRLRELLAGYGCEPQQLVPWAATANGDIFHWIPRGEPDCWPTVLVAARQFDQEVLPGTATRVLLGLLDGSLRSRILPDDFPSDAPGFEPLS